jgi:flagellar hook-basal body complex protein FliE
MIIPAIGGLGGLGSGLGVTGAEASAGASQAAGAGQAGGAGAASGGESSSFGGELTEAISSLEQTQDSAASASQALAAGTASDPESAVVTVEDAQLAMELASQIRTKATEATQSIFNTQV